MGSDRDDRRREAGAISIQAIPGWDALTISHAPVSRVQQPHRIGGAFLLSSREPPCDDEPISGDLRPAGKPTLSVSKFSCGFISRPKSSFAFLNLII
jgi:hypothetical protein